MGALSGRMAWSGTCQSCYAIVVIGAHDESTDEDQKRIAAGPDEWDSFPSCYACDGSIDWNGSDPVEHAIVHH